MSYSPEFLYKYFYSIFTVFAGLQFIFHFKCILPSLPEDRLCFLQCCTIVFGKAENKYIFGSNCSQVCRKLNVTVLSDEIYGLLKFKGQHHSMAQWYPEGTLVTSGFSKWSSAGGWRIGYIVIPQNMDKMMTILQSAASQTYSCAPAPMQFAIAKVLKIELNALYLPIKKGCFTGSAV